MIIIPIVITLLSILMIIWFAIDARDLKQEKGGDVAYFLYVSGATLFGLFLTLISWFIWMVL